MTDRENTSTEGTQTLTDGGQTERIFTQDDVNRIVQERLAKEKSKGNPIGVVTNSDYRNGDLRSAFGLD